MKVHSQRKLRAEGLWAITLVAILGLPVPCWSQFKPPVRTDIGSNADLPFGATFSGDMLEAFWTADLVRDFNIQWDIWWSRRDSIDSPWQTPEPLDIANTSGVEGPSYFSYDGLTLTFSSNGLKGGYGGLDLWQTTRASRDAPWQEPVNMGPTINTRGDEGGATFSPDGLEIIFNNACSTGGNCPPSTLRRSTRESLDGEWTTPERMTPSRRGDPLGAVHSPSLSADGLSLYFTGAGEFDRDDVFVAKRPSLDALFGEPENLGTTINSRNREIAAKIAPDGSLYYGYNWPGTSSNLYIWRAEPEVIAEMLGDFDGNGVLDISDIDDLLSKVAAGENPSNYDLNDDTMVDTEDIRVWVKDVVNTWVGDANLDGEFNSGDMVEVFQAGNYELDTEAGWAEGDWNGDRRFDSGDMVAAFQDGGYELGTRTAVSAVPEPSYAILLGIGMIGLCPLRKRR